MDPLTITLPARPAKSARPAEPAAPLNFGTFVETVDPLLKEVRARLEQRHEDTEGATWWLTFNRASCLYRFTCDHRAGLLILEKGQGSFVPNSLPTWRTLDSRPQSEPTFETSVPLVRDMLTRFVLP